MAVGSQTQFMLFLLGSAHLHIYCIPRWKNNHKELVFSDSSASSFEACSNLAWKGLARLFQLSAKGKKKKKKPSEITKKKILFLC